MLLVPTFTSGLQKHPLPFHILPLKGSCGPLENALKENTGKRC